MATTATVHQTKWWSGGKSPFNLEYGKLMMWYFLMSDAFTFGAFLISYGSIRFSQNFWPDPNVVFNAFPGAGHANLPLAFVSVMTFILIISSVTMVLAVHAGHKGDKAGVLKWLAWTIVGGIAFLGCQAWEWHHLITGEHAVLIDGKLDMIGQTMRANPWGDLANHDAVAAALTKTPHETLVNLAHTSNHALGHEQLVAMTDQQLISNINLGRTACTNKRSGCIWRLFLWYYRFPRFPRILRRDHQYCDADHDTEQCIPEQGSLPDDRKGWFVLALCRPGLGIRIPLFLPDIIKNIEIPVSCTAVAGRLNKQK